jgi:hypothetical protein
MRTRRQSPVPCYQCVPRSSKRPRPRVSNAPPRTKPKPRPAEVAAAPNHERLVARQWLVHFLLLPVLLPGIARCSDGTAQALQATGHWALAAAR